MPTIEQAIRDVLAQPDINNVKTRVSQLELRNGTNVSEFYKIDIVGDELYERYEFSTGNIDELVTAEIKNKLKLYLEQLRTATEAQMLVLVPKVPDENVQNVSAHFQGILNNEDAVKKLVQAAVTATRILAGVYIIQNVNSAFCKQRQVNNAQVNSIDGEIGKLKDLIQRTSEMLFKMDSMPKSEPGK